MKRFFLLQVGPKQLRSAKKSNEVRQVEQISAAPHVIWNTSLMFTTISSIRTQALLDMLQPSALKDIAVRSAKTISRT